LNDAAEAALLKIRSKTGKPAILLDDVVNGSDERSTNRAA
jgi:hypothetical protein